MAYSSVCASRIAILGAGHLAAALVEGFSRAGRLPILIHNRTPSRAAQLACRFENVDTVDDEAVFDSDPCPLLLVLPGRAVLEMSESRARRLRESGRLVVSCANGLPLSLLEARFPGIPFAKAIPSVAASVCAGVTLVARGASVDEREVESVRAIFGRLGRVVDVVSEEEIDRLSIVTSCFPGMLAAILDEFAVAYELTQLQTRELLLESSLGALLLARERRRGFGEIAASVRIPGGLTEVGVSAVHRALPPVFNQLRLAFEAKAERRRREFCAISQE